MKKLGLWLNRMATPLLWVSVFGQFYYGFGYVHPVVYEKFKDAEKWMFYNRCLCYFMCFEVLSNWFCMRFIKSPWKAFNYEQLVKEMKRKIKPIQKAIDDSENTIQSRSGITKSVVYDSDLRVRSSMRSVKSKADDKRPVVPYWSWKTCDVCQELCPPRTHHCPLCDYCVLKRDHHCYVAGACIGLKNQRHLIVFNVWSHVVIFYSLVHTMIYLYLDFCVRNSIFDTFLPFAVVRCALGYISLVDTGFVIVGTTVLIFLVTTGGFIFEQIECICKSATLYEKDHNMKIITNLTVRQRVKAVFGDYPALNLLLPIHWLFETPDDGVTWADIKVERH